MRSVLDFNELKTPAGHGEVLVLPDQLADLAESNARMLRANEFRVLDVSSLDCRSIAREVFRSGLADKLWIITGHQPEFIHPGVWAKHLVTQRLADCLGGVAANLIVDHDAAKDVTLTVPAEQNGRLRTVHVSFAPYQPGMPWELVKPLSKQDLADFAESVKAAYGARYQGSLMPTFFAAAAGVQEPQDWVAQMNAGRRAIDAMFGVEMIETRAHELWGGPLLAQMLLDAERFFACYNDALHEYRQTLNIKGTLHPIPDLDREDGRLELPIWAVRADRPRQRVFVDRQTDRIELFAERDSIGILSVEDLKHWQTASEALAAGLSAGLRPRALTLTFWARLFLADVFVHGIGGAKYDRITDVLIRKYFDITPPTFSCVSATLRLDLPAPSASADDLRDLARRQRDVRHNPQRYVPRSPQSESLLATKTELVQRSNWLHEHQPSHHFERRDVFDRIQQVNRRMLDLDSDLVARLDEQYRQVSNALRQAAIANNREYFVGLFRRQDLQLLCDMLPSF